jgi:3-hydroxyisobutyrate dehydrogenase-like beta-hydroxyacid dehydrogenase
MNERPRIGFIGLGIMGRPMVKNLLKAGYDVTVWNRSRPGIDDAVAAGAKEAASAKDVAVQTDVIITMVTDSPDVEQVIMGPNGVIEGVRSGSTVIDMSTISPEVTRQIAGKLAERGVEMLDAPVSGGDQGAIAGTLSIMVGGKREVFDRCQPVFEAMGKKIVHCGGHGAGQTVKLCNQIAVCLTNLATCETMVFATKMGVDPAVMMAVAEPRPSHGAPRFRSGLHGAATAEGHPADPRIGAGRAPSPSRRVAGPSALRRCRGRWGRRRGNAGAGKIA